MKLQLEAILSILLVSSLTFVTSLPLSEDNVSSDNSTMSTKGQIQSLLPDPSVIVDKINSTFQSVIQQINNTLSNNPIFGQVHRMGDPVDLRPASNVPDELNQISRPAERKSSSLSNDNLELVDPVVKKSANNSRQANSSSSRKMWDQLSAFQAQVDSNIQQSISNARENFGESFATARQGGLLVRNQTMGIINEIQRIFSGMTEPFKRFLSDMRGKLPTAVVTA